MTKQHHSAMITRSGALMVRRLVAGIIVLLLLLQLFAFERVVATSGVVMGWVIMLVLAELGSLPFLLGVQGLPRIVRVVSALCGPLMIGLLFGIESMALAHQQTVVVGAVLELPAGTWSLWFIAGLAASVAWGLVPSCSEWLRCCRSRCLLRQSNRSGRKRK